MSSYPMMADGVSVSHAYDWNMGHPQSLYPAGGAAQLSYQEYAQLQEPWTMTAPSTVAYPQEHPQFTASYSSQAGAYGVTPSGEVAQSSTQMQRSGSFATTGSYASSDFSWGSPSQSQLAVQESAAPSPVPGKCATCGVKATITGTQFCSRRCNWQATTRCPQCGRGKSDPTYPYCTPQCCQQALQANWCPICGVCQINQTTGCCSNIRCAGSSVFVCTDNRRPTKKSNMDYGHGGASARNHHGGQHHYHSRTPHEVLSAQEAGRTGLLGVFSVAFQQLNSPAFAFGSNSAKNGSGSEKASSKSSNDGGEIPTSNSQPSSSAFNAMLQGAMQQSGGVAGRVINVIKVNTIGTQKKRYLSYRSVVESTMSHLGMSKYGHGGEGNEQRKYFPLSLHCTLGNVAGGAYHGNNGNTYLQCCNDPSCEACQVLAKGMSLQELNRPSHYCTSMVSHALPWSSRSPAGYRAVLVARVVVGNPDVLQTRPDDLTQPDIQFPANPDLVHSTVITNGDLSQDGTYVFRDDAVDPLFIVIVE